MSLFSSRTSMVVWAIGPGFLAIAAWLTFATPHAEVQRGEVHLIPLDQIKPGPIRKPLADASLAVVNGASHPCSECHKLFTPSVDKHQLIQHKDIVLNHGMNARCLNCHDGTDRDKLVLHDGTLVPFSEAPRLCSQCHGTLYRDWQRGMHGKTMGSWDASSGKQHRLACNECHNPHAPAYRPFVPLPGPNTMRMGDQSHKEEPEKKHTPLRRWSQPAPEGEEHDAGESTPRSKEHGS